MKTRQGFVSNSSSASFIIMKENLSVLQLERLCDHGEYAKKIGDPEYDHEDGGWDIIDQGNTILCTTHMDNFDLKTFAIKHLGLKESDIVDEKYGHW